MSKESHSEVSLTDERIVVDLERLQIEKTELLSCLKTIDAAKKQIGIPSSRNNSKPNDSLNLHSECRDHKDGDHDTISASSSSTNEQSFQQLKTAYEQINSEKSQLESSIQHLDEKIRGHKKILEEKLAGSSAYEGDPSQDLSFVQEHLESLLGLSNENSVLKSLFMNMSNQLHELAKTTQYHLESSAARRKLEEDKLKELYDELERLKDENKSLKQRTDPHSYRTKSRRRFHQSTYTGFERNEKDSISSTEDKSLKDKLLAVYNLQSEIEMMVRIVQDSIYRLEICAHKENEVLMHEILRYFKALDWKMVSVRDSIIAVVENLDNFEQSRKMRIDATTSPFDSLMNAQQSHHQYTYRMGAPPVETMTEGMDRCSPTTRHPPSSNNSKAEDESTYSHHPFNDAQYHCYQHREFQKQYARPIQDFQVQYCQVHHTSPCQSHGSQKVKCRHRESHSSHCPSSSYESSSYSNQKQCCSNNLKGRHGAGFTTINGLVQKRCQEYEGHLRCKIKSTQTPDRVQELFIRKQSIASSISESLLSEKLSQENVRSYYENAKIDEHKKRSNHMCKSSMRAEGTGESTYHPRPCFNCCRKNEITRDGNQAKTPITGTPTFILNQHPKSKKVQFQKATKKSCESFLINETPLMAPKPILVIGDYLKDDDMAAMLKKADNGGKCKLNFALGKPKPADQTDNRKLGSLSNKMKGKTSNVEDEKFQLSKTYFLCECEGIAWNEKHAKNLRVSVGKRGRYASYKCNRIMQLVKRSSFIQQRAFKRTNKENHPTHRQITSLCEHCSLSAAPENQTQ